MRPLAERILARVEYDTNGGCWLWAGAWDGSDYGHLRIYYRHQTAHRLSWQAFKGPIPDGLCVLHRCDVRCCVNPDHLFLGTCADNTADMIAKGRQRFNPPKRLAA